VCGSGAVTVGGGEIFQRYFRPKMVASGRSDGEDSDEGGFDDH